METRVGWWLLALATVAACKDGAHAQKEVPAQGSAGVAGSAEVAPLAAASTNASRAEERFAASVAAKDALFEYAIIDDTVKVVQKTTLPEDVRIFALAWPKSTGPIYLLSMSEDAPAVLLAVQDGKHTKLPIQINPMRTIALTLTAGDEVWLTDCAVAQNENDESCKQPRARCVGGCQTVTTQPVAPAAVASFAASPSTETTLVVRKLRDAAYLGTSPYVVDCTQHGKTSVLFGDGEMVNPPTLVWLSSSPGIATAQRTVHDHEGMFTQRYLIRDCIVEAGHTVVGLNGLWAIAPSGQDEIQLWRHARLLGSITSDSRVFVFAGGPTH